MPRNKSNKIQTQLPTEILPGMTVQVIDPDEPPCEWVSFTVTRVRNNRVFLLSPGGLATWAFAKELLIKS